MQSFESNPSDRRSVVMMMMMMSGGGGTHSDVGGHRAEHIGEEMIEERLIEFGVEDSKLFDKARQRTHPMKFPGHHGILNRCDKMKKHQLDLIERGDRRKKRTRIPLLQKSLLAEKCTLVNAQNCCIDFSIRSN